MQLLDIYFHHFSPVFRKDFWLFEFSILLHTIARSLVTVFVPVFLLNIGFSLGEVIIYLALYNGIDVPLNFFARWLTYKIGARKTIILGTLAAVGYFTLLLFLDTSNWSLLLGVAFAAAVYDTLYWVAHLYLFIETNKKGSDAGKQTGILYTVRRFGSLVGPIVGALILILANRDVLIAVSIIIFVLSIVPLLKMRYVKDKPDTKLLSFREFFKHIRERKDYASVALYAIHRGAEFSLWPIFIFTVFGSIEAVAAVPIIIAVTTMIFSYFAGQISSHKRGKMIIFGATLIVVVWMLRLMFDQGLFLYLSVFFIGLFSLLVSIPIDSGVFTRARNIDALSASTYRNAASMGAKFIFFAILAFLVNVFNASFIIAMLALFVLIFINYLFITRWYESN